MSRIEDLFDPTLLNTVLDGKTFDPNKEHNAPGNMERWFSWNKSWFHGLPLLIFRDSLPSSTELSRFSITMQG
jgi:hypothetical protein